MNKRRDALSMLEEGRDALRARLDRRFTRHYAARFEQWALAGLRPGHLSESAWRERQLFTFLVAMIEEQTQAIQTLESAYQEFMQHSQHASGINELHQNTVEFLQLLGSRGSALRADQRAFERWFAQDGVIERYQHVITEHERHCAYLFGRCGDSASRILQIESNKEEAWSQLNLEKTLLPAITSPTHESMRETALSALGLAMAMLPAGDSGWLSTGTVAYLFRCAQDYTQPLWLQCQALSILWRCAPLQLQNVLKSRLSGSPHADDFFFRKRALEVLLTAIESIPALEELLPIVVEDPSAYVRQTLANRLATLKPDVAAPLMTRLLSDVEPSVQAAVICVLPSLARHATLQAQCLTALLGALAQEAPVLTIRVALKTAPAYLQALRALNQDIKTPAITLEQALTQLHQQHEKTAVRRWAASAREAVITLFGDHAKDPVWESLPSMDLGATRTLPRNKDHTDAQSLGRALVPYAQQQFGYNLQATPKQWKIVRDHQRRFRLWRFLHEWRTPATDKRQNYSHLTGRVYPGLLQVPAHNVAELSKTKVPGEPLHIAEEGGWRPYLPLVDQLISALDQDWPTLPLEIYTTEGVTRLFPPTSLAGRLKARSILSVRFEHFARLRNWTSDSPFPPETYLNEIRALGFRSEFQSYTGLNAIPYPADERVKRFFPAVGVPISLVDAWQGFQQYFFSVYQNTLSHLAIFLAGMAALFFGQHTYQNLAMKRARARIPLVIGGWGTRGKSGTERLKAAVFNALGYQVLSKTTGCEAMFLHGHAMRPLREMFLFRPYDKATIWEQVNLVRLAARMKVDVMLWECMGLNPRYVDILQNQWMRDDLSTITNCYPDHEDIQGPSGVDVPQVIARFIPKKGRVITSEENMLPFLLQEARHKKAQIDVVDWLDAALITPDVLARFPYEEHPYNIALVVKMAASLGVEADFALKEMADRVIPDLGVLKAYPVAQLYGRRLEFINGMSANERHGTLSNWTRMGFDGLALENQPDIWVTTVVNNRADRVARSQVFARILVNDISADRHFLIGGNLDGLMTYIREAFDEMSASFDWRWHSEQEKAARIDLLTRLARRYRVPLDAVTVQRRLCAMLGEEALLSAAHTDEEINTLIAQKCADQDAERAQKQWADDREALAQYEKLMQQITADPQGTHAGTTQEIIWQWLMARLCVVHEYYTTGNQLIDKIALDTPPGMLNRIMGIQNIKGTGLDFVYRWQAWDAHCQMIRKAASYDMHEALQAVKALAASQEFGLVDEAPALALVERLRAEPAAQSEVFQSELSILEANVRQQLKIVRASLGGAVERKVGWGDRLIQWLETFLDAGEAVKRRKQAERIYQDLAALRISHARAAKELKLLTQAQKGGWLSKRLSEKRQVAK